MKNGNSPVISVKNVTFSYNRTPVLIDVSLDVFAGDFLAVIGPNGGGKSTLLKLIMGLYSPQRGEITVLGSRPKKSAPRIGYVPQNTTINPSFPVTVMDVVLMGRLGKKKRNRVTRADREAAMKALSLVGMDGLANRKTGDLSGGQQERVFIARALATDAEILILDEPTASIDSEGRCELLALLGRLNKDKTIILVTHDIMFLSVHVTAVACVNRTLHYHPRPEITHAMIEMGYPCPVEMIAHGVPHRVLADHKNSQPAKNRDKR